MPSTLGLKNGTLNGDRIYDPNSLTGTRKVYSETYLVTADSVNDSEEDILAVSGVPLIGAFGRNGWCVGKFAREVDASALLWEVTCEFDSQPPSSRNQNPDLLEWSWSAESIDIVLSRDVLYGTPVTNSVGQPILIETPVAIPVLTVSRVELAFTPNTILNYVNTVNLGNFYGAPTDTALMADIRDEPTEIDGTKYRRVTYVVKFNLLFNYEDGKFNGWVSEPLNVGTKYLENAGDGFDAAKPALTNGVPTETFLNLNGTRTNTPNYLIFHKHLRRNFGALQLGPFGY